MTRTSTVFDKTYCVADIMFYSVSAFKLA